MKSNEAIKAVMETKGVRFSELRRRIGIESNTLAGRLRQDNISVEKMNEMLRVMDYKIVVMPCDARTGSDWIELE